MQASDVSNGATRADINNDVNESGWGAWRRVRVHGGAWGPVTWSYGAWERVGHVISGTETLNGAWRRMLSTMASRLPRVCRLAQDNLSGTFTNVIGAIFAAAMQRAVVFAVWNSLTTTAAGPEPKDDGWMMSEVQRRVAAAAIVMSEALLKKKRSHTNEDKTAKKRSEQWLWYNVRNTEWLYSIS